MADVVSLRLCRTKLLDALSSAQRAELPRIERQLAEQQRRRLHNALQAPRGPRGWPWHHGSMGNLELVMVHRNEVLQAPKVMQFLEIQFVSIQHLHA